MELEPVPAGLVATSLYIPVASWVILEIVSSRREFENVKEVPPITVCSVISMALETFAPSGMKYQLIFEVCTGGVASTIENRMTRVSCSRPSKMRFSASTTGGTVY